MRVSIPQRRDIEGWRLSARQFFARQVDLTQLAITQKPSLIPGAGHGMLECLITHFIGCNLP